MARHSSKAQWDGDERLYKHDKVEHFVETKRACRLNVGEKMSMYVNVCFNYACNSNSCSTVSHRCSIHVPRIGLRRSIESWS